MAKANELIYVHPSLRWWSAYESSVKCDLASVAYRSLEGWVIIDPIELSKEGLEELESEAQVAALFLTNENHARSAEFYRKRYGVEVWASEKAAPKLEIKVDQFFKESTHFDLEIVEIPGATEGEVCFFSPEGIVVIGDAIVNLPGCEFSLLPAKYAWHEKMNRQSLQKLLDFPIDILTFAHGAPVRGKVRERLMSLVKE